MKKMSRKKMDGGNARSNNDRIYGSRMWKGESSTEEKDGVKTIEWWTPNWDEVESKEMAAEFEKNIRI